VGWVGTSVARKEKKEEKGGIGYGDGVREIGEMLFQLTPRG